MKKILISIMVVFGICFAIDIDEMNNHWGEGGNVPSPIKFDEWVFIPEGVTLTIEPNTIIEMGSNCRILIEGNINAIGTLESPIIFKGTNSGHSSWSGIQFFNETNSTSYGNFEFCRISDARRGIGVDSKTQLSVRNSLVYECYEGIDFTNTDTSIICNSTIAYTENRGVIFGFSDRIKSLITFKNNIVEDPWSFTDLKAFNYNVIYDL